MFANGTEFIICSFVTKILADLTLQSGKSMLTLIHRFSFFK
jgi:hypothetical protein